MFANSLHPAHQPSDLLGLSHLITGLSAVTAVGQWRPTHCHSASPTAVQTVLIVHLIAGKLLLCLISSVWLEILNMYLNARYSVKNMTLLESGHTLVIF